MVKVNSKLFYAFLPVTELIVENKVQTFTFQTLLEPAIMVFHLYLICTMIFPLVVFMVLGEFLNPFGLTGCV